MKVRKICFCAALGWASAACGSLDLETGPLDELERNERRWESQRPETYRFEVERLCYCGVEARGPVRIEVRGALVTSRVYVDSGDPVSASIAELFPAVDGLFEILRDAIESKAADIRVTYDPHLGVPVDFWIDYQQQVADEELGMKVTGAVEATTG